MYPYGSIRLTDSILYDKPKKRNSLTFTRKTPKLEYHYIIAYSIRTKEPIIINILKSVNDCILCIAC